jgi:hypothetical protein
MIFIQQDQLNHFALTLMEKSTIAQTGGTPFYLFRFTYDLNNGLTDKKVIPYYISSNTRYDYIQIEEDAIENLTGGTVSLPHEGWYTYEVYEQTSQYNLQLSATTSLVEHGKAWISGTTQIFF